MLKESARHDALTGTAPDNRWGYGKIDTYAGLIKVLDKKNGNVASATSESDLRVAAEAGAFRFFFPANGNETLKVAIYDIARQAVASREITNPGDAINISALSKGIYIVVMDYNGITKTAKAANR